MPGVASTRPDASASDLCRAAVEQFKVEAFDNIDVIRMLQAEELNPDDVKWIGRRLMGEGRSLEAYEAGRRILSMRREPNVP